MKTALVLSLSLLVLASFYCLTSHKPLLQHAQTVNRSELISQEFERFKELFNRQYTSQEEEFYRLSVFIQNLFSVEAHNADPLQTSAKTVFNQFGDLTDAEITEFYLMKPLKTPDHQKQQLFTHRNNLPASSIDWRNQNAVNPAKDQKSCGSCWSFSTTGSMESAYLIFHSQNVSLSEQNLVDCCGQMGFGCEGCNGAWPYEAAAYASDFGITTESEYPYTAKDGTCRQNIDAQYFVQSYSQILYGDIDGLTAAINQQPVSVCIDASGLGRYTGGIWNSCSSKFGDLNHAVLLVGYESDSWIIQNSWGPSWGENGYFRIARNGNQNTCGIAHMGMVPTV